MFETINFIYFTKFLQKTIIIYHKFKLLVFFIFLVLLLYNCNTIKIYQPDFEEKSNNGLEGIFPGNDYVYFYKIRKDSTFHYSGQYSIVFHPICEPKYLQDTSFKNKIWNYYFFENSSYKDRFADYGFFISNYYVKKKKFISLEVFIKNEINYKDNLKFYFIFVNNDSLIFNSDSFSIKKDKNVFDTNWTKYTCSIKIPKKTKFIIFSMSVQGGYNSIWLDDLKFILSNRKRNNKQ